LLRTTRVKDAWMLVSYHLGLPKMGLPKEWIA